MTPAREVSLLLVEDDHLDVINMKRALKTLNLDTPLVRAEDGVEALEILRGDHPDKRVDRPFLILLDLNLPRMNGLEFLAEIRADPSLHASVVFVLTTSKADEDVAQAYDHNVAGYVVKADASGTVSEVIKMLDRYRSIVELPH